MKAISALTFLTPVFLFFNGNFAHADAADVLSGILGAVTSGSTSSTSTAKAGETKEACVARVTAAFKRKGNQGCDKKEKCVNSYKTIKVDGKDQVVTDTNCTMTGTTTESEKRTCLNGLLQMDLAECDGKYTQKDLDSEKKQAASTCRDLLRDYDDATKNMQDECVRTGVKDVTRCKDLAEKCSGQMSAISSNPTSEDSEDPWRNVLNLIGVYQQTESGAPTSAAARGVPEECLIHDEEKIADAQKRIDDEIQQLKEEMADLNGEKRGEIENDVAKAESEAADAIAAAEEDLKKEQFDMQDAKLKKAADLERMAADNAKKQRIAIAQINAMNVEISNLAFDHQKVMLDFAGPTVRNKCEAARDAEQKRLTETVDAKGNVIVKKLSAKEARAAKAKIIQAETDCLNRTALDQSASMQVLINKKRAIQANIDQKNAEIADDQKDLDRIRAEAAAIQAKDDAELQSKLDDKNKKIARIQKTVTDQRNLAQTKLKANYDKMVAKNEKINKLMQERLGVKARFEKVFSNAPATNRTKSAAQNFVSECCGTSGPSDQNCRRVVSESGATTPKKAGTLGSTSSAK